MQELRYKKSTLFLKFFFSASFFAILKEILSGAKNHDYVRLCKGFFQRPKFRTADRRVPLFRDRKKPHFLRQEKRQRLRAQGIQKADQKTQTRRFTRDKVDRPFRAQLRPDHSGMDAYHEYRGRGRARFRHAAFGYPHESGYACGQVYLGRCFASPLVRRPKRAGKHKNAASRRDPRRARQGHQVRQTANRLFRRISRRRRGLSCKAYFFRNRHALARLKEK